jgi:hypothetical protein
MDAMRELRHPGGVANGVRSILREHWRLPDKNCNDRVRFAADAGVSVRPSRWVAWIRRAFFQRVAINKSLLGRLSSVGSILATLPGQRDERYP